MKLLVAFIMTLFLIQSCQTKDDQNKQLKSIITNCDELDIIYYSKDTFTYRMKDPTTIGVFTELISNQSEVNEFFADTCETTQKLIYKAKGQQVFTADISIAGGKDGITCNYVLYFTDSKMYRNRLTYRAGMAIDQIYSHRMK